MNQFNKSILNIPNLGVSKSTFWVKFSIKNNSDKENLRIVSKHLFTLLKFDFPNKSTRILDNDQIKIAGARYNRGTGMSITALRMNTSYGDFLLKNSVRIRTLLSK